MKPGNDVDLVGSILHLVIEEIDNTNFGIANHRRQFRESIKADFDIMLQLFQHFKLVPAQLTTMHEQSGKRKYAGILQFAYALFFCGGLWSRPLPAKEMVGIDLRKGLWRRILAGTVDESACIILEKRFAVVASI